MTTKRAGFLEAAESLEQEATFLEEEGKAYKARAMKRLAEKARSLAALQSNKPPLFRPGDKVNVRRADNSLVILGGTLEYGGQVPHVEDEYLTIKSDPASKWTYCFCERTGVRLVPRTGRDKDGPWRWVTSPTDSEFLRLEKYHD